MENIKQGTVVLVWNNRDKVKKVALYHGKDSNNYYVTTNVLLDGVTLSSVVQVYENIEIYSKN